MENKLVIHETENVTLASFLTTKSRKIGLGKVYYKPNAHFATIELFYAQQNESEYNSLLAEFVNLNSRDDVRINLLRFVDQSRFILGLAKEKRPACSTVH